LNHAEDFGHVTFATSHVEEARGGEKDTVDTSKGGERHEDGHDPPHEAVQTLGEHLKNTNEIE
jgi:hypothetical protein